MGNISITCQNYSGAYATFNGTRPRNIHRLTLLRAIVTLGAQKYSDILNFGWRKLLHRFGIGISAFALTEERAEGLCLANAFYRMDMSEKGAISYWYGMGFAKIAAEFELNIPWLGHVDDMKAKGFLTTSIDTKMRGDFAGKDINNDWHVIEAKGRSYGYSPKDVAYAKGQAARVITIRSCRPQTSSACMTLVSSKPISILLDDPPPDATHIEEHWEISDENFLTHYYQTLWDYIHEFSDGEGKEIEGVEIVSAPIFYPFLLPYYLFPDHLKDLQVFNLRIGLQRNIYENPMHALEIARELPHEHKYIGKDGIALFGDMPE